MEITLVQAGPEDRPTLDRLLQLNEYDYSEWAGVDVDSSGLFPSEDTSAMWRPGYHVYFIKVDGNLAGFALLTQGAAYVGEGETNKFDVFFVMRKYRRQGVGEHVACMLFDRFPGRWEIDQLRDNLPAQAFWRRVIGRYTDGDFREIVLDDDRWRGPVQLFTSPAGTR